MSTAATIPKERILPAKDAANFRSALRLYEAKQYKKALKSIELVLKKRPDHGESLALKGLILCGVDKKEEGYSNIMAGIDHDPASYMCWHVLGIYHRTEKNYEESAKSFAKAYSLEPDNQNVLRDLSVLQMQLRQYDSLIVSRRKMLNEKPGFRQSWTALAIAQHLNKQYAAAEATLNKFEEVLKEPLPKDDLENSEILLYKNVIIYDSGDVARALENLESIADMVLDKLSVMEYRAKYHLELGHSKEATREYRALIKRNPEERAYYHGLEAALGITAKDSASIKLLYERLSEKYPKSDAPKFIPLQYYTGEDFKSAISKYLTFYLVRGVPSTFVMIKPLYEDVSRRQAIEEFILNFYESLQGQEHTKSSLNGNGSCVSSTNGLPASEPTTLLWVLHFLAQHYSFLGQSEKALAFVNKALEHTPTLVESLMVKGQILKRAGDVEGASVALTQAREMDAQDRFINSKTAKYLLRANKVDEAVEVISLFTKNDANGKGVQDLQDMQAHWFIIEQGETFARLGNIGLALKRFHCVFKIFDDYHTDQYDFHLYSTRRGTVRSYIDMIRWEDKLYAEPRYKRAAVDAITIYLRIHDKALELASANGVGEHDKETESSELTEAERKKALKKAKKERAKELKREQEERDNVAGQNDPDPLGTKLVGAKDPVEEAYKIWKPLGDQAADQESTWRWAFEIYIRQHKYVLALQALNKGKAAGAAQYWIDSGAARLRLTIESDQTVQPAIKAIALKSLPAIAPRVTEHEDTVEYLSSQAASLTQDFDTLLCWIKAILTIKSAGKEIDQKDLEQKTFNVFDITTADVFDGFRLYNLLKDWNSPRLEEFKGRALQRWPRASIFS